MSTSRFAVTALAALGISTLAWPVITFTTSPEGFDLHLSPNLEEQPAGQDSNWATAFPWGVIGQTGGVRHHLVSTHRAGTNPNAWILRQSNSSGQGGTWFGNFGSSEQVFFYSNVVLHTDGDLNNLAMGEGTLWINNADDPTPFRVAKLGAYVQTAALGQFTAQIRALTNDGWTSWHSATGNSTNAADGSTLFLGAASTSTNLISVQIRARSVNSAVWGYYAISRPSYSFTPVPEPATMTALALGCAFLRRRRKACKSRNA